MHYIYVRKIIIIKQKKKIIKIKEMWFKEMTTT